MTFTAGHNGRWKCSVAVGAWPDRLAAILAFSSTMNTKTTRAIFKGVFHAASWAPRSMKTASPIGQGGTSGGFETWEQTYPRRSPKDGIFKELFMTQSETKIDVSVEERSLHLFKSERQEDLVAIGLAALLVLAVLLGVRI